MHRDEFCVVPFFLSIVSGLNYFKLLARLLTLSSINSQYLQIEMILAYTYLLQEQVQNDDKFDDALLSVAELLTGTSQSKRKSSDEGGMSSFHKAFLAV